MRRTIAPATSWRAQLDQVRALTTDNPEQQTRLQTLERLISGDLGGFSPEQALRERDQAARAPVPLMLNHKLRMDAVRSVLADMEAAEVRLDRIREHAATRRWGVTTAFLIAGTLVFVVVVAQMATQRRISEARRRRSEDEQRLLQAVFAGIDDGITLQDRTGKVIFANAAAARMIGFASPAALLGASPREIMDRFELLDEDGHPYPPDKLPARAVLTGAPSGKAVIRYRARKAGPWRWSEVNAHPVTDADGTVIQAINVFRDVTAERDADERRRFLLRAVDELSSSLDYEAHARGGGAARRPRPGGLVRGRHRRRGSAETSRHGARRSGQGGVRRRAGPALPSQSVLEERRLRDHSHGQAAADVRDPARAADRRRRRSRNI